MGGASISGEEGGRGTIDAAGSDRLADGLGRSLVHLGALDGAIEARDPPRVYERFVWVRAREAGFFRPRVAVGDVVEAGTTLGTIIDFFETTRQDLTSPVAGEILFLVVSAAMDADGLVCGIAEGKFSSP